MPSAASSCDSVFVRGLLSRRSLCCRHSSNSVRRSTARGGAECLALATANTSSRMMGRSRRRSLKALPRVELFPWLLLVALFFFLQPTLASAAAPSDGACTCKVSDDLGGISSSSISLSLCDTGALNTSCVSSTPKNLCGGPDSYNCACICEGQGSLQLLSQLKCEVKAPYLCHVLLNFSGGIFLDKNGALTASTAVLTSKRSVNVSEGCSIDATGRGLAYMSPNRSAFQTGYGGSNGGRGGQPSCSDAQDLSSPPIGNAIPSYLTWINDILRYRVDYTKFSSSLLGYGFGGGQVDTYDDARRGGGRIVIEAPLISVKGRVLADGESAKEGDCMGKRCGAGAGGTVILNATMGIFGDPACAPQTGSWSASAAVAGKRQISRASTAGGALPCNALVSSAGGAPYLTSTKDLIGYGGGGGGRIVLVTNASYDNLNVSAAGGALVSSSSIGDDIDAGSCLNGASGTVFIGYEQIISSLAPRTTYAGRVLVSNCPVSGQCPAAYSQFINAHTPFSLEPIAWINITEIEIRGYATLAANNIRGSDRLKKSSRRKRASSAVTPLPVPTPKPNLLKGYSLFLTTGRLSTIESPPDGEGYLYVNFQVKAIGITSNSEIDLCDSREKAGSFTLLTTFNLTGLKPGIGDVGGSLFLDASSKVKFAGSLLINATGNVDIAGKFDGSSTVCHPSTLRMRRLQQQQQQRSHRRATVKRRLSGISQAPNIQVRAQGNINVSSTGSVEAKYVAMFSANLASFHGSAPLLADSSAGCVKGTWPLVSPKNVCQQIQTAYDSSNHEDSKFKNVSSMYRLLIASGLARKNYTAPDFTLAPESTLAGSSILVCAKVSRVNGTISASSKGCPPDTGKGKGCQSGGGGGHGGEGGFGTCQTSGATYDRQGYLPGSGGGSFGSSCSGGSGGSGGGYVAVVSSAAMLAEENSVITADASGGQDCATGAIGGGGGGAGGSVHVSAGIVCAPAVTSAKPPLVTANGGGGATAGGGGGGGVVNLTYLVASTATIAGYNCTGQKASSGPVGIHIAVNGGAAMAVANASLGDSPTAGRAGLLSSPSCSPGFGGSWCTRCPYGTYKSVAGSQECYWCNKHSSCIDSGRCYWVDVGATTDDCSVKCAPGYVLPECRTPLDQLIYTLGGPILFSIIILAIILVLALVCFGVCLYVPACPGYQQRRRIKINREKLLLQALRENRSRLLYYEQEIETGASVGREELSGFASASPATPLLNDGVLNKSQGWYTTRLLTTASEAKKARKHLHLQESDLDVHVYRIYLTGRNSPTHPWVLPKLAPYDVEPMFWPREFARMAKDVNKFLNWNTSPAAAASETSDHPTNRGMHRRRISGGVGTTPSTLYISSDLGGTSSLFSCCASLFGERLLAAILSFLCFPLVAPFQRYCRRVRAKNAKAFLKAYSYECMKSERARTTRDCLKFDSSDDYSLAFVDVLGTPSMSPEIHPRCKVGGKPALPLVLLLAGDGSYFRPYHLDTNDIMVRSIHTAGGIGGFIHEQWVTLVSELNARLRTVHRARLRETIEPVLDLLKKQNEDSDAMWGGLCVHLGCFWPNALEEARWKEEMAVGANRDDVASRVRAHRSMPATVPSSSTQRKLPINTDLSASFGSRGFTTFAHRGSDFKPATSTARRSRESSRRTTSSKSDAWMPKSLRVRASSFQLGLYIARGHKSEEERKQTPSASTPGRRSMMSPGASPEAWTPSRADKSRVSTKKSNDRAPTYAVVEGDGAASESKLPRLSGVLSKVESDAAAAAVAKFERAMALRGGGRKSIEEKCQEPEISPEGVVALPATPPSRHSSMQDDAADFSFWRAPYLSDGYLKLRVVHSWHDDDDDDGDGDVVAEKLPYPGFLIRPMTSLQEIGFDDYDFFDDDDVMYENLSGDADATFLARLDPASSFAQFKYSINYHMGFLINYGRPSSRFMRQWGHGPLRVALLLLLLVDVACIFMLALYFGAMEEPAPTPAPTVAPPPTFPVEVGVVSAWTDSFLVANKGDNFPAWFSIGHVLFISIYPFACIIAPVLGFSCVMYPISRVGRHYASWNFLSVTNSIVAVALCLVYKRDLYEYCIAYAFALLLSKFLQAQMINWLIASVETSENGRRRGFRPRKKKPQTPSMNRRSSRARDRAKRAMAEAAFQAPSSSPSLYASLAESPKMMRPSMRHQPGNPIL